MEKYIIEWHSYCFLQKPRLSIAIPQYRDTNGTHTLSARRQGSDQQYTQGFYLLRYHHQCFLRLVRRRHWCDNYMARPPSMEACDVRPHNTHESHGGISYPDSFHYMPADGRCFPQIKPFIYQSRLLLHLLMKPIHPHNSWKTSKASHQPRITPLVHPLAIRRLSRMVPTRTHAQPRTVLPPLPVLAKALTPGPGQLLMGYPTWLIYPGTAQVKYSTTNTRVHTVLTRAPPQINRPYRAQGGTH